MDTRPLDDVIADLREAIRRDVAGAFVPAPDIARRAIEDLAGEAPEATLAELAPRLASDQLADQLKQQSTWPATTDCDRLDAAFAALENSGILARQNYTCCGTCGTAEICDEVQAAVSRGARGYTFYHEQDTEHAVDGGGLFLNYGSLGGNDEGIAAVAREVDAVLRRHGMAPVWSGDIEKRIALPLHWQRRRSADEAT